MRLLLDTHIFLWYVAGDERIGSGRRRAIENADAVFLSVASVWEALIKHQLRKLLLPEPAHGWLRAERERHGIESLPINEPALARLSALPLLHRDPFDRLLICQAAEHDLQIVTADTVFARYGANVLAAQ